MPLTCRTSGSLTCRPGALPRQTFIIYVLSLGAVAKVEISLHSQKPPAFDHLLNIVYFPVMWGAEHSRPFSRAMHWYLFTVWKLEPDEV